MSPSPFEVYIDWVQKGVEIGEEGKRVDILKREDGM